MVHAGKPDFFRTVNRELQGCQIVLAEGIPDNDSPSMVRAAHLAFAKRFNLEIQTNIIYEGLTAKILWEQDIKKIPVLFAILNHFCLPLINLLTPMRAMIHTYLIPKKVLLRSMNVESISPQPITDNTLRDKFLESQDIRDQALLHSIEDLVSSASELTHVGICYGAKHSPVIVNFLMNKYRYKVVASRWVEVFTHEEG